MERPLKERLIGAAVLMAAAIILIPEMLSGPRPPATPTSAPANSTSEAPLKSYTIDLNPSSEPSAQRSEDVIEEEAPAAEETVAKEADALGEFELPEKIETVAQTPDESAKGGTIEFPIAVERPAPTSTPVVPAPAPVAANTPVIKPDPPPASGPRAEQKAAVLPLKTTPIAPPLVSNASVPTSKSWAVQLGSFSSLTTAERMVQELKASKYEAFVMPVKSGANTLYRVRIGPIQSRTAAEDTLRKVKAANPNAAVVAHP